MTTILTMSADIIIDIIKFLEYTKAIILIDLLKYHNKELLYYTDDKIFNIIYNFKFKNYLESYNISNLYECITNSSFNLLEVDNNFNELFYITKENKETFIINYNIDNDDVSLTKILNSINIFNIFINIVHDVSSEFIINNPYHYIHIHITDNLINYLKDVNIHNYKITNKKHIKKSHHNFRFNLYNYNWNKTDISIYYLFQLYLVSIDFININILNDITQFVVNNKYKKNTNELLDTLKLFYTYDVNDILDDNLKYIKYIKNT